MTVLNSQAFAQCARAAAHRTMIQPRWRCFSSPQIRSARAAICERRRLDSIIDRLCRRDRRGPGTAETFPSRSGLLRLMRSHSARASPRCASRRAGAALRPSSPAPPGRGRFRRSRAQIVGRNGRCVAQAGPRRQALEPLERPRHCRRRGCGRGFRRQRPAATRLAVGEASACAGGGGAGRAIGCSGGGNKCSTTGRLWP